jgi:hypothetical protein
MKNKKKVWAIALFGLFVVVMSSGIQTVSAGPLGGGDSFEKATEIHSGYTAEAWLSENDEEYFYISVNPGQTLVVTGSKVTDSENGFAWVDFRIFDENMAALIGGGVTGNEISKTLLWTPNSEKKSYKLYIRSGVTNSFRTGSKYALNITVKDHYDASTRTDAGDTFDTAMNITQGSYDGFLAGSDGNDHKDVYKLALESGEKINVKLTPSDNVKLNLRIYNEDRAEEKSIQSPDTGVITRASWTAPSAQEAYVLIEWDGKSPSRTYDMDISVEAPGEHGLSITAFETPSTVAQGDYLKMDVNITKTASFEDWYTVVVSGVNENGYPLAGTALVKLACDFVTVPVWIGIPPAAETGEYNLYADVYTADGASVAYIGPEVVNVTA